MIIIRTKFEIPLLLSGRHKVRVSQSMRLLQLGNAAWRKVYDLRIAFTTGLMYE
jgi:hypothetical protein